MDMRLGNDTLEVREFGQSRRLRTNSARANEPHEKPSKTTVFGGERSEKLQKEIPKKL